MAEHVHLMLVERPKAGVVGGIEGALQSILDRARHAEVVDYTADTGPKLEQLVQRSGDAVVETIDLVGHGSTGVLLVGGTASPNGFVNAQGATLPTLLDADVDKQLLLARLFRVIRDLPPARRGRDFRVRLLGCRVGLDEGLTDETSPVAARDGAVLIHHLASFLDVPVEAPVEYIFASDFDQGHFEQGARVLRRCTVDPHTRAVEFEPAGFFAAPPPDLEGAASPSPARSWRELVDVGAAARIEGSDGPPIDAAKVAALVDVFPARARALASAPLVALDAVLVHGATRVAIASAGRELIVEREGELRRVRGCRSAQAACLELLEGHGVELPMQTRCLRRPKGRR